jgi:phosphoserine phosphatase
MSYVTTIIARRDAISLSPATINQIRNAIRGGTPSTLSAAEAVDIPVSTPPDRAVLDDVIEGRPIDAVTVRTRGRRKALLIADMDSTIVTSETLDEVAAFAGLKDQIAAITRRSMNGEIDFADALRERVGMLRGLGLDALDRTWAATKLTPGARELVATMRAHNAVTALVSGGFTFFTEKVAALVGFDVNRANILEDDGTSLTGQVREPILDRDAKRATLEELAAARNLKLAATLAVGDGANDLTMLATAGLGVAFHAKPIVAREARARVDHADLRALLFAQGYPASAFVTP